MTTTCTIVIHATGERCGAPAVATFKGRTGVTYGECVEHFAGHMPAAAVEVGARVTVRHIGIEKAGTVVGIAGKVIMVEVPIHGGKATKVVRVPATEVVR